MSEIRRPPAAFGFSDEEIDEAYKELSLLKKVFGNFVRAGDETFNYMIGGTAERRVIGYLQDRAWFFGPTSYRRNLVEARCQLDANKEKLRTLVDPPLKRRPHLPDWKAGQDVFYAWIRRGYERAGIDPNDVPELIASGITQKLREKLKAVGATYGKARYAKLKIGKLNPRPIKHPGRYVLGPLSDHAFGNAVDIDTKQNAQIDEKRWDSILGFTHMSLDRPTRKTLWNEDPQTLHSKVEAINAAFVHNLQAAVARQKRAAASMTDDAALTAAIKGSAMFKDEDIAWIKEHKDGFFNLPWALVKALRDEECVWGAVFRTVDLHHFQLPEAPPPPLPGRINLLFTPRRPDSERAT